jgi:hypothetical protein
LHFEPQISDIVEIVETDNPVSRHQDSRLGVAMVLAKMKAPPWNDAVWVKLLWSDDAKTTMSWYRIHQFQLISER